MTVWRAYHYYTIPYHGEQRALPVYAGCGNGTVMLYMLWDILHVEYGGQGIRGMYWLPFSQPGHSEGGHGAEHATTPASAQDVGGEEGYDEDHGMEVYHGGIKGALMLRGMA